MKITRSNLARIMGIENLSQRKAKLQSLCLAIGWHGGIWQDAVDELARLNKMGVKTPLEIKLQGGIEQ